MSYRHDLALRFAVLKALAGELTTAKRQADCEIRDTWRPGDRLSAHLPDGEVVAAVTLAKGKATAKLSDEATYRAWVEQTHPNEVETITITRVRPEFTERILSAARQLGVPVDAATGEEVPGVTVDQGDPYPMVRPVPGASVSIAKAWQAGELGDVLGGLLAVEGGEPDE